MCNKHPDDPNYYIYLFSVSDVKSTYDKIKQLHDKLDNVISLLPSLPK